MTVIILKCAVEGVKIEIIKYIIFTYLSIVLRRKKMKFSKGKIYGGPLSIAGCCVV